MSKFSKIEDLYPKEYQKFYESDQQHSDSSQSESDTEIEIASAPQKKQPKKVRFTVEDNFATTEPAPQPLTLKEKVINICRENLINIAIVLVGFILMSNDYVIQWISENVTNTPVASMALRALGAALIFLTFKVVTKTF